MDQSTTPVCPVLILLLVSPVIVDIPCLVFPVSNVSQAEAVLLGRVALRPASVQI